MMLLATYYTSFELHYQLKVLVLSIDSISLSSFLAISEGFVSLKHSINFRYTPAYNVIKSINT